LPSGAKKIIILQFQQPDWIIVILMGKIVVEILFLFRFSIAGKLSQKQVSPPLSDDSINEAFQTENSY
jgi:hypothetical protein